MCYSKEVGVVDVVPWRCRDAQQDRGKESEGGQTMLGDRQEGVIVQPRGLRFGLDVLPACVAHEAAPFTVAPILGARSCSAHARCEVHPESGREYSRLVAGRPEGGRVCGHRLFHGVLLRAGE